MGEVGVGEEEEVVEEVEEVEEVEGGEEAEDADVDVQRKSGNQSPNWVD